MHLLIKILPKSLYVTNTHLNEYYVHRNVSTALHNSVFCFFVGVPSPSKFENFSKALEARPTIGSIRRPIPTSA